MANNNHLSPKVSGFTFINNGLSLGYPIKESILSIEPLCDEIIINVGFNDEALTKDDGTYQYLRDNFPNKKFIFLKSFWNPLIRERGLILSEHANIALKATSGKYAQYIQADEIIHENDLPIIEDEIKHMDQDNRINGLVFNYIHFYGNTDIIKHTRNIYRREIRLIRNNLGIESYLDAQGFRHQPSNKKVKAKIINARIFHYGWAREQVIMSNKVKVMDNFYHGNEKDNYKDNEKDNDKDNCKGKGKNKEFIYENIWGLKKFNDQHPYFMRDWIEKHKNNIDILKLPMRFEFKNLGLLFSDLIERYTNYRIGEYKNYELLS
ncbi:MAG: hypothetical protein HQK51_06880 [Oligoflexia bacterium]|nr:hypothetical protein [Oligoflexia bacterium]